MEEKKYVHRLPPCPDYDMAGVESWLEALAKEGLLLEKDTPFFGFYSFYPTAPRAVRYRLEPAVKTQGFWDGEPGQPMPEAQSLYSELGWEYVTRYGEFHIYRSFDPHARELHTDGEIQAEALNILKKRQRATLTFEIGLVLVYSLFGILRYPMGIIIAMGLPAMLCFYGIFLFGCLRPLYITLRLQKLRKAILSGESIRKTTPCPTPSLRRPIVRRLPDLVLFLFLCIGFWGGLLAQNDEIALSEFSGDPPFVTVADLNPDGTYRMLDMTYANNIRNWSTWPFVENWEWYEYASIQLPDGETVSGPLDVKYLRAASPIFAQWLARELIAYADSGKYFTGTTQLPSEYENIQIWSYQGKYGLDMVLILCDNIVIEAEVLLDNANDADAKELWIQRMCQMLTETP